MKTNFVAAIRFWPMGQCVPEIVLVCKTCLFFVITRDTYALDTWMRQHSCGSIRLDSDIPAAIDKAVAFFMEEHGTAK
jgi:hypothetical protein